MKKAPNIWRLRDLFVAANGSQAEIEGRWVPARPLGFYGVTHRFRAAWMVFTGKADAVVWPGNQ